MNDVAQPRVGYPYYLLTAALCGALIMVIEVLGSRVIGPFFGVSLFVWTSLISVAMIALAAGYGVGGVLSDRLNHPRYLYLLILIAGILTLLVPVLKGVVLKACMPLGLRAGAFVSTLLLFGPALFLLGCVSPFLVKILASELRNLGRVVGGLYALSTVGSILGTVLTGFVLVAYLGVDQIYALAGALLIALGTGYHILFERRWLSLALLLIPLLLWPGSEAISKVMADGTRVELIEKIDGHYGSVKVVDYSFGTTRHRDLMIDGLTQSGIDVNTGLSLYAYPYLLQFLPWAAHPNGKHALVIGLGGGIIPSWYQAKGVAVDVVDIDPDVVATAKRHFNFRPQREVHIADARYFLSQGKQRYDYIILDAFNGDITPGHLISREALELMRQRLTPQGVLGLNIIGSLREQTLITASIIHTLEQVFDQVHIVPVSADTSAESVANLAIIAYQGERKAVLPLDIQHEAIHPLAYPEIASAIRQEFRFPPGTPAMTLTDNYNPVDFHDLWLRERVRNFIVSGVDWDILIE